MSLAEAICHLWAHVAPAGQDVGKLFFPLSPHDNLLSANGETGQVKATLKLP